MKKYSCLALLFVLSYVGAQDKLTLEKALALGQKNNYSILIRKNLLLQSQNNFSKGNAGMLPSIGINLDGQLSSTSINQEFVTGNEVDKEFAQSTNFHSDISFAWTLFDGLKMYYTYDKLKQLNELSKKQLQSDLQDLSIAIMANYYQLVVQSKLISANSSFIAIYKDRLSLEESKLDLGIGSKKEVLSAKIDLNKQLEFRVKLESQLLDFKIDLNRLICAQPDTDFIIQDSIPLDDQFLGDPFDLNNYHNSIELEKAEIDQQIKQISLDEIKAQRFPSLSLNAAYALNRVDNQAGFLLYNQNHGWSAGLSSKWNLFNGASIKRAIKNAKLDLENSRHDYHRIQTDLIHENRKLLKDYKTAKSNRLLHKETLLFAEEYLSIQLEKYRLGECTSIEFNESQQKYQDALVAVLQSEFEAKMAELNLKKQQGLLLK